MGSNIIIIVFAVVVIGGMGSILGSVVTGLGLGVIEGLTRAGLLGAILGWPFTMVENLIGTGPVLSSWIQKLFGPEGSSTIVFVIMAIVLLVRPAGLFGREK
jgi:branched-chain amino acid transport system permease protein